MKIEKFLFHLLVFSIPIQTRLVLVQWTPAFNEWTSGFLWGTDILFVILLFFWRPKFSRSDYVLLAFISIGLISISQSILPSVSWYRFLKLLECVIFYFYIKQSLKRISTPSLLALTIVFSGLIQAIIGIVQIFLQHDIGLRILGESVLQVDAQGVAVVAAESEKFLRAYGTAPHPNVLAVWLMLSLWSFGWWYLKSKRSYLWLIAGATLLFCFYLTFSRVAILFGGLATIIVLIMYRRRQLVPLLIAGAVVSSLFLGFFWPQVNSRFAISSEDEAVAQRIFYSDIGKKTIMHAPVFGIGIGQFVPMLMKTLPHYQRTIYQPAHSLFLLVIDELGIIGFIVFLIFLFSIMHKTFQYSSLMFVLLLSFLSLGFFDHYFWTLQQGGLMLWGFIAIAIQGEFWYPSSDDIY